MHLTSFDHLPCSNAPSNEPHTVPQTVVPPKKVAHTGRPKAPVDLAHCPLPVRLADCSVNARPGVVPGRAARTRVSPGSNLAPTLPCTSRHRPCPSRCGLDLPTPAPPGVLGRPRCLGPPGTVRSMPGIPQSRVQLTVTDRRAQHGGGALFGRVQRPPKASINLLERCTSIC